jgi:ankyrin repeat protein
MLASFRGNFDIVRELLNQVANVNEYSSQNNTALHLVCMSGYLDIVRELIAHGAIVNAKKTNGRTPLHNATFGSFIYQSQEDKASRRDIIKELIRNGTNISMNQKDYVGETPLHIASIRGQFKLVRELIPYFDLSIVNNENKTALDLARHFINEYETSLYLKKPDSTT